MVNKNKLNAAFRALRKQGFAAARQNFMCCGGCASAALADGPDGAVVYYHKQAGARLRDGGVLYLMFGYRGIGNLPEDLMVEQAGRDIVRALRAEGLNVVWDGRYASCVEVHPQPVAEVL